MAVARSRTFSRILSRFLTSSGAVGACFGGSEKIDYLLPVLIKSAFCFFQLMFADAF